MITHVIFLLHNVTFRNVLNVIWAADGDDIVGVSKWAVDYAGAYALRLDHHAVTYVDGRMTDTFVALLLDAIGGSPEDDVPRL